MKILVDNLQHPAVLALIREHLQSMYEQSPPESVHALGLDALRGPGLTFWCAWADGCADDGADKQHDELLLGCGALKELDATHGEIKSMRTPNALRRRGAGRAILEHIINVAKQRGYERLSLETGSTDDFIPARKLYEHFGFTYCGPFADYVEDPYSSFMTLALR
jgi:putative acetyltransferase